MRLFFPHNNGHFLHIKDLKNGSILPAGVEEVFEEYDVVRLQPAIKFLAGIVVNEICRRIVIGVFKIDAMFGIGIGLVDPVNKRLFIPDDEKITIEQG